MFPKYSKFFKPVFRTTSTCKHSNGYLALKSFLSKVEENVFSILPGNLSSFTLRKDVWFAIRGLDHSIVIKPAIKLSCVVLFLKSSLLAKVYRLKNVQNVPNRQYTKVCMVCYIKPSTAYQRQKHQRFYIIIQSFSCSLLNLI